MKENIQKIIDDLKMYYKNYNYLIERRMNDEAIKQLYHCRGMTEVLHSAEGITVRETFAHSSDYGWEDATPMESIIILENDNVIEEYTL